MSLLCAFLTVCGWQPEPVPHPLDTSLAFLTVYDTALCNAGEVCLQGNGDGRFANMQPVTDDAYLKVAACPMELHGKAIKVPAVGLELKCWDTFGTWNGEPVATVFEDENGRWLMRVDVFYPIAANDGQYPAWNAGIFEWEIVQ